MSEEEPDEDAVSNRRPRPHREPVHRTLFIPIEDLQLDTVEGQNELLRRAQVLLATKDHNNLDLQAFKILKDTVKIKTDLNVWFKVEEMRKELTEFKAHQKTA
jgi:hypothetical protein